VNWISIRWGDDEKATPVEAANVAIAFKRSWAAFIPETHRWYNTLIDLLIAGF
jgi:hypothetical protein